MEGESVFNFSWDFFIISLFLYIIGMEKDVFIRGRGFGLVLIME